MEIETRIDDDGRERGTAQFGSPGSVDEMFVGPSQAMPIVFVPGIMGSPLIAVGQQPLFENQGKWAWFPDGQGWMLRGYGGLSAWDRKELLNPAKTRALSSSSDADRATVARNLEFSIVSADEALRRGWGSVMMSSYGKILEYLEAQLRFIYYRGNVYPGTQTALPREPERWGELSGYSRLTDAMLRKAAGWRYPVYAAGYNWLDTNSNAADYLKRRIDQIKADCQDRLRLQCNKVILVTHSMGGLVARMCAKRYPNSIAGIVHGVQPAVGAATAYARVRAGWESNSSIRHPITSVVGMVGAWVLGPTGAEVSTVFANAAGPLELLPNHLYGNGWLKVTAENSEDRLFSLPSADRSDPYEAIYREPTKWWRLIHPGLLVHPSSSGNQAQLNSAWLRYSATLDKAKAFHTSLGNYYHPATYAHCGADARQPAWHRVGWRMEPLIDISSGVRSRPRPDPASARDLFRLTSDRMEGTCTVINPATAGDVMVSRRGVGTIVRHKGDPYRGWLLGKDDEGDATVPAHSGVAPRNEVRFFAQMKGFEHQSSYAHPDVKAVTLYSILRLAAETT